MALLSNPYSSPRRMIFLKSFGAVFFLSIAVYLTLTIRHKENATNHAKNAVIRPRNALRVILIIRENWLSGLLRGIAEKAERGHRSILQVIISRSGKHESAERKTTIRGEENANPRKERGNTPKERTSCNIDYTEN